VLWTRCKSEESIGVGRAPVMIEPSGGDRSSNTDIVSAFGKSTYREPYLSMSAVPGLVLVKNAMPDLRRGVASNTVSIMERAVITSA
jgi:hypothetical protein